MANRASIPSKEAIENLPQWAAVAFAARCARRVQPLLRVYWPQMPGEHTEAVERAIGLAERAAATGARAGAEVEASRAIREAVEAAGDPDGIAANAAGAAYAAMEACFRAAGTRAAAARAAVRAGRAAHTGDERVNMQIIEGIGRDFEHLMKQKELGQWTSETPVPQEVFERLWPEGEPDWSRLGQGREASEAIESEKEPGIMFTEMMEGPGEMNKAEQTAQNVQVPTEQDVQQAVVEEDAGSGIGELNRAVSQERTNIPNKEEIAQLPRWARIAFAARCVRRVQPLYEGLWPDAPQKHISAIEHAIALAERTAAIGLSESYESIARKAATAADPAIHRAAAYVAYAASSAAAASGTSDITPACEAMDSVYAAVNSTGSEEIQSKIIKGICRDFEGLKLQSSEKEWSDRMSVPQDVFGPMWPEGEPDWAKIAEAVKSQEAEISKSEKVETEAETGAVSEEVISEEEKAEVVIIRDSVVRGNISDQPAREDQLGYAYYVDGMAEFLTSDRTEAPLALSIEGPWGSGKSSFMMLLREKLATAGKPTVWFNAWRHDKAEEMCATFALVFIKQMQKAKFGLFARLMRAVFGWPPGAGLVRFFRRWGRFWKDEFETEAKYVYYYPVRRLQIYGRRISRRFRDYWDAFKPDLELCKLRFDWKDGWIDVFRYFGVWVIWIIGSIFAVFVGWKGGASFFQDSILSALIGSAGSIGSVIAVFLLFSKLKSVFGSPIENNLRKYIKSPNYEEQVNFIEAFHNDFEKIVRAYAGDQKVYVFIDDIDRCMVPRSADLMQALNMLICNSPNLIFIVGMDREKVAAGLAVKFEKLLPYLVNMPVQAVGSDGKYVVPPDKAKEFGYQFIEKFIQLPFILPRPDEGVIREYVRQLCKGKQIKPSAVEPVPVRADFQAPMPVPQGTEQKMPEYSAGEVSESPAAEIPNISAQLQSPAGQSLQAETEEKREEIRERVDTDQDLLCRVGEIAAEALENNPRRIKQFINLYRLRTYLASGRKLIKMPGEAIEPTDWTLERLAKFVAIELRWPMFLADVLKDRELLRRMQLYAIDTGFEKTDRWGDETLLVEFLRAGCTDSAKSDQADPWNLADVNIEALMKAAGTIAATTGETGATAV